MCSLLILKRRVLLCSCYRGRISQTETSNLVYYKFSLAIRTSRLAGGDSFHKQIGHFFHHDGHLSDGSRCLVVRLDLVDSPHSTRTTEVCIGPAQAAERMIKKLARSRSSHSCMCSLPCVWRLAHLPHGNELENIEIWSFALNNC
jgi:hypothetical protein